MTEQSFNADSFISVRSPSPSLQLREAHPAPIWKSRRPDALHARSSHRRPRGQFAGSCTVTRFRCRLNFFVPSFVVPSQTRGIFPSQQATIDPAEGVLPFMSDLMLSITKVSPGATSILFPSNTDNLSFSTSGTPPHPPLPHPIPLFLPPHPSPSPSPFRPAHSLSHRLQQQRTFSSPVEALDQVR